MAVNYEDERFDKVEEAKDAALAENDELYGGMISQSDQYYQDQMDAAKDWADQQSQLQQEQTDFAIEQVEQQKEQAHKDYLKEQSGAYTDWQKQSSKHGVNAEQAAANGMNTSGWSESSQVSMYNTYQNRVASARESYNLAVQNYNNAITEARLQNNAALAQIAYESLQTQLELSLQGFQYKNQLLLAQADRKMEIENNYYERYQDVLAQINHENALAEEIRQFNESMAEEKRQFAILHGSARRSGSSGGGGGGSRSSGGSGSGGNASINRSSGSSGGSGGSGGRSPSVDPHNVMSLGYGPISAENLANKVKSGEVNMTRNGNTYVFSNNSKENKKSLLFSQYNVTR